MMVAVDLKQSLNTHAEIASGLETIDIGLREPRRSQLSGQHGLAIFNPDILSLSIAELRQSLVEDLKSH